MMSFFHWFLLLICGGTIVCACREDSQTAKSKENASSSAVTIDWPGTYLGVLPCADCAGIETALTLQRDRTYRLTSHYLGKTGEPIVRIGAFQLSEKRDTVTLQGITSGATQFLVRDKVLIQLDLQGQVITGELADRYVLTKTIESRLHGYRWNLESLMGKYVSINPAYITLDTEKGTMSGSGWCNSLEGAFEIGGGGEIVFTGVTGGDRICQDSVLEGQLRNMFGAVNFFTLDNGTLSFFRNPNAPIAVFQKAHTRG